ncbi:hypothetical protein PVAP13_3KG395503 [Panicum virgatum]|uniref:Uncharacterized protein n=1 Tax=Panicum virgatum TaxID=38727 RepID=A0A8T0V434_PANVG|nr:hypothetical protein PVAP13_3KG395503 [Panicum virgatum]
MKSIFGHPTLASWGPLVSVTSLSLFSLSPSFSLLSGVRQRLRVEEAAAHSAPKTPARRRPARSPPAAYSAAALCRSRRATRGATACRGGSKGVPPTALPPSSLPRAVQLPLHAQLHDVVPTPPAHELVPPPRREGEAAASNRGREGGPVAPLAMPAPTFRAVNLSSRREARRRSSLLDPARREKSARRRRWGVEGRGRRGEIGEGRGAPAPPRARLPLRCGACRLGAWTTLEPPSLLAPWVAAAADGIP